MPDWDADSPELRRNLTRLLDEIARAAERRAIPTVESARSWQRRFLDGLDVLLRYVGAFRGEPGLENIQVRIGDAYGTPPANVAEQLKRFEEVLQTIVAELDKHLLIGNELNADELAAVIDLCAWTHAEWVRIHPLANGNGRTARVWANFLAMRYGLPPFVRLRPRPDSGYEDAAAKAMRGDWEPTAVAFQRLLNRFFEDARN
ncbi:MAG TPA: Fic family protein [Terriglobales bacterium]|nr:Fic family protein [Terriglobales bacterium]